MSTENLAKAMVDATVEWFGDSVERLGDFEVTSAQAEHPLSITPSEEEGYLDLWRGEEVVDTIKVPREDAFNGDKEAYQKAQAQFQKSTVSWVYNELNF